MAYGKRYHQENVRYSYGSTAVQPERRVSEREKRAIEREYLRNARLQVEERVKTKRKENKALTFLQCLVVSAALFAVIGLSALYIVQLSLNHDAKAAVDSLTKQVQELHEDNLLLENEAAGRIDYDSVYTYATEELGMGIPEKRQVIYYAQRGSEYVTVRAEIPHE